MYYLTYSIVLGASTSRGDKVKLCVVYQVGASLYRGQKSLLVKVQAQLQWRLYHIGDVRTMGEEERRLQVWSKADPSQEINLYVL